MAKKSRHQVALEERIEQLKEKELEWRQKAQDWGDRAAECERIAMECEATWGELQAILDLVDVPDQEDDGTNQEEDDS